MARQGMSLRRVSIALILLGASTVAAQVGFASPPYLKLLDGEESRPYVVGFTSSSTEGKPPSTPHRTMLMRNANGTVYRCYLPPVEDASGTAAASSSSSGGGASGSAGTSLTSARQGSLAAQKKPSQLLEALGEHCYYYYDEWWTYEVCYRKHVRQYHKTAEGQVEAEYLLGVFDELEQPEDEDTVQVDTADVSGGMRYVSQVYSGGDTCELTSEGRQAEVRFTCGADSTGTRVASIKEPSSCRYVITVATPRLCKHRAFQEQPVAAGLIRCHPLPPEEQEEQGAAVGQCNSVAGMEGVTAALAGREGDAEWEAAGEAATEAGDEGGGPGSAADNATHDDGLDTLDTTTDGGEGEDGVLTAQIEGDEGEGYTDEDDEGGAETETDPYE